MHNAPRLAHVAESLAFDGYSEAHPLAAVFAFETTWALAARAVFHVWIATVLALCLRRSTTLCNVRSNMLRLVEN